MTGPDWAREVAARVDKLPVREAVAIRLIYTHRVSFREAALRMQVPDKEITRLVGNGLRQLGESLGARRSASR